MGRGIVESFLAEGAQVQIGDIDEEAATEAVTTLQAAFGTGRVACSVCDVANERQVESLVADTIARWRAIDILVNNAGLSEFKNFHELTVAEFDRVLNVNLRGAFLCTKYAASHLEAANGCVLNITSTRAMMSEAGSEAYAASKGGLLSLTHALAVSLGPAVRVNAISPGWIEVGDWQKTAKRRKPEHSKADKAQHPVGRVGLPADIGQAAVFLCSDDAGFITGQNLVIDGGMTIKMIYV